MNKLILTLLAFAGGTALAAQSGFNAQLGGALKNPILASVVAFLSSAIFAFVFFLLSTKTFPTIVQIKGIPIYLWFTGGLLSMIGIGLYLYTIPKLGISLMISVGLCGQLIFAAIADHFGWMNLPIEPFTLKKGLGIVAMISGILITNMK